MLDLHRIHERSTLTAREREILTWVARGKTNVEIASALWISPGTVRKHLENV
jgi:DNA-binding CsgD family transcriptional regulator